MDNPSLGPHPLIAEETTLPVSADARPGISTTMALPETPRPVDHDAVEAWLRARAPKETETSRAAPHPTAIVGAANKDAGWVGASRDTARKTVHAFGILAGLVILGFMGADAFQNGLAGFARVTRAPASPALLALGLGFWGAPGITYLVLIRKTPRQAQPSRWSWPAIFSSAGLAAVAIPLLWIANARLDLIAPDVPAATVLFAAAGLAGAASILVTALLAKDGWRWPSLLTSLGLTALTIWPAIWLATDYGKDGGGFMSGIGVFIAGAAWIYAALLAVGVVWIAALRSPRHGGAAALAFACSIALGITLTCAYMLFTMDTQAATAYRANQPSPGDGLVSLVMVFVTAAIVHRRRAN